MLASATMWRGWLLVVGLVIGCSSSPRESGDDDDGGGGAGASGSGPTGPGSGPSTGAGGALDDGRCRSDSDCDTGDPTYESCIGPGETNGCGACWDPESACTSDDECSALGEHQICAPVECPCSGGQVSECRYGCANDAECFQPWLVCSNSHCVDKPCAADSDCPSNFACGQAACVRRSCTLDAECDGFCVEGHCSPEAGWCQGPAA